MSSIGFDCYHLHSNATAFYVWNLLDRPNQRTNIYKYASILNVFRCESQLVIRFMYSEYVMFRIVNRHIIFSRTNSNL